MKKVVCSLISMAVYCIFSTISTTTSSAAVNIVNPPADKLNLRIHQQFIQINRDAKAGKLTAAQAKALKAQVEAIRKEELADVKASDSKTLTDDQLAKLNGELDTLSKQIPIP